MFGASKSPLSDSTTQVDRRLDSRGVEKMQFTTVCVGLLFKLLTPRSLAIMCLKHFLNGVAM